ncbi:toxin-antitoxin system YwqK family antitoxin [Candidatus Riflebacteria bacterium]
MTKIILFFVLFTVVLSAGNSSTRREPSSKERERNDLMYIENEQTPYTGIIFQTHSNGKLKWEGNFKDGKMHGIEKSYDKNGRLWYTTHWKNGELLQENNFENGKSPDVTDREWDDNGEENATWKKIKKRKIKAKEKSTQQEIFSGESEAPEQNSIIRNEIAFVLDDEEPYTKNTSSEYSKGRLIREVNYKAGKKHGTEKSWHKNGKLRDEINYKDGKKHGIQKEWNKKGKLIKKIHWKNGTMVKKERVK